jgi:hypothetical protein
MTRHHIIISGTGRAGTTFLVQLLTELGLDTGFSHPGEDINSNCNAGMEWDLRDANAPYIVKSPHLCDSLADILRGGGIVIEHAYVPVRDLFHAAQSRRRVSATSNVLAYPEGVPGGLWLTKTPQHQEMVLTLQLYKLTQALAEHDIPTTLLDFPRLVSDAEYLYRKLGRLMQDIEPARFLRAHRHIARPELIHDFSPESMPIRNAARELA